LLETSVMHWLKHTPASIMPMMFAVQGVGTYSLPFVMMGSGTQRPPLHVANALSRAGGMVLVGTQCEGPNVQQPAPGSVEGSWPG
jgi:hypothetical protein